LRINDNGNKARSCLHCNRHSQFRSR